MADLEHMLRRKTRTSVQAGRVPTRPSSVAPWITDLLPGGADVDVPGSTELRWKMAAGARP